MPAIAIHPGEHLAEELNELGMSASELARKLDVPPNRITAILNRLFGARLGHHPEVGIRNAFCRRLG